MATGPLFEERSRFSNKGLVFKVGGELIVKIYMKAGTA